MEWEGLIIVLLCNNFAEVPNGPEKTLNVPDFQQNLLRPIIAKATKIFNDLISHYLKYSWD